MTDEERATALADSIHNALQETGFGDHQKKGFVFSLWNTDAGLIIAALRAYARPTEEAREAVARAIDYRAILSVNIDSILSALQAAGWGPRASLFEGELTATSIMVNEASARRDLAVTKAIAEAVAEERARCLACQPSTAEDPNESAYQRGRFDGIMEYAAAISAMRGKTDERLHRHHKPD